MNRIAYAGEGEGSQRKNMLSQFWLAVNIHEFILFSADKMASTTALIILCVILALILFIGIIVFIYYKLGFHRRGKRNMPKSWHISFNEISPFQPEDGMSAVRSLIHLRIITIYTMMHFSIAIEEIYMGKLLLLILPKYKNYENLTKVTVA